MGGTSLFSLLHLPQWVSGLTDFGCSNTEAAPVVLHPVLKQVGLKTIVSCPSLTSGNSSIGFVCFFLPWGNVALGVEQDCVTLMAQHVCALTVTSVR